MTANLQKGLTVAQAAKMLNISERLGYMAMELVSTGREDLCTKCEAGEMSILGALKIAKPEKYAKPKDTWKALVQAWNAATDDERGRLLIVATRED